MPKTILCPQCQTEITVYKNPVPTVDVLIAHPGKGVILIERRFEPPGWALPGGFVDYGESVEAAALREAREETSLDVRLCELLGVYSDPARDSRLHTISTVFIGVCDHPERLQAGDDAAEARFFSLAALPAQLAFDHGKMLKDFSEKFAIRYGL